MTCSLSLKNVLFISPNIDHRLPAVFYLFISLLLVLSMVSFFSLLSFLPPSFPPSFFPSFCFPCSLPSFLAISDFRNLGSRTGDRIQMREVRWEEKRWRKKSGELFHYRELEPCMSLKHQATDGRTKDFGYLEKEFCHSGELTLIVPEKPRWISIDILPSRFILNFINTHFDSLLFHNWWSYF